eukprot:gene15346-21432_t
MRSFVKIIVGQRPHFATHASLTWTATSMIPCPPRHLLTGRAGQLKVALAALYRMEFSVILPATPAAAHAGLPEYGVVLLLQSLAILWFLCPFLVCLHECAHSFTAHIAQLQTCGSGGRRGGASADQTTHVTMSDFFSLRALAFLPLYVLTGRPRITPPQVNVHIHIPRAHHLSGLTSTSHPEVDDIIRHAGWILSTLLALLLSGTFHDGGFLHVLAPLDPVVYDGFIFYPIAFQLGALSAAWLVALSAISSDLLLLSPHKDSVSDIVAGQAHVVQEATLLHGTTFFCGNLGMLIAGVAESAVDYARVLRTQVAICMQRGAQSGGVVTMVGGKASMGGNRPQVHGVASRSAPGKRDNLSQVLSSKLNMALSQKSILRGQRPGVGGAPHGIFCGHTRFATSSIATESESHPHQWNSEATEGIRRVESVGCDFDFCNLLGQYRTHHDVEHFLTHVLARPPQAQCDSAMVAGMMEYLRTQGRFYASLRLACYDTSDCLWSEVTQENGAAHADEESGMDAARKAPTAVDLQELAALMEKEMLAWLSDVRDLKSEHSENQVEAEKLNNGVTKYVSHGTEGALMQRMLAAGQSLRLTLIPKLAVVMKEHLAKKGQQGKGNMSWMRMVTDCTGLAEATLENFLHADIYRSTCRFMKSAKGSFGLAVTCTLDTDKVALAAWGQPMTLGFNFEHKTILYSSESQNVMIPILKKDSDPLDVLVNFAAINQTYWVDMDEGGGEVMLLQLHNVQNGADEAEPGHKKSVEGWPMIDAGGVPVSLEQLQWFQNTAASNPSFVTVRMYQLKASYEVPALEAFVKQERIVNLVGNKYIKFQGKAALAALAVPGKNDLVAADLSDTPRVLNDLRESWNTATSPNRQSAASFFANLDAIYQSTIAPTYRLDPLEVHLLIVGVEMGLWLAEQAANDLRLVFPFLKVQVLSANKIISVLGNSRGKIPVPGSAFCRLTSRIGPNTICLSVSQSGQTFPTIHATRILNALMPGRVYVMTGQVDIRMPPSAATCPLQMPPAPVTCPLPPSAATCPLQMPPAPVTCPLPPSAATCPLQMPPAPEGCGLSLFFMLMEPGWRSAEPPTVVAIAMHQCLTELITYSATSMAEKYFRPNKTMNERREATYIGPSTKELANPEETAKRSAPGWQTGTGPLGMGITPDQLLDLRIVRDSFIDTGAPSLVGVGLDGESFPSSHYRDLRDTGRKWAKHVTETPIAWALSLMHITATVFAGWPILYSITYGICKAAQCSDMAHDGITMTALLLDCPLYMFLPWVYASLLRLLQGRHLMHRWGKRTVVICDVPFVHQITETYVSKLWALSYGMASLDVQGGSPQDHFVHRFTHRVVRGLLIAVGRPDGRMYSQTKTEAATILSILQAKVIRHMGGAAEVVSVGSNPFHPKTAVDINVVLPDFRPRSLIEVLELGHDEEILNDAPANAVGSNSRFKSSKPRAGTSMKKRPSRASSWLKDLGKNEGDGQDINRDLATDMPSNQSSRKNSLSSSESGYAPPAFNTKSMNPNQLWAERRAMVNSPSQGERGGLERVSRHVTRLSVGGTASSMSSSQPTVGVSVDRVASPDCVGSDTPAELMMDDPLNPANISSTSLKESRPGPSSAATGSHRTLINPSPMPASLLPLGAVARSGGPSIHPTTSELDGGRCSNADGWLELKDAGLSNHKKSAAQHTPRRSISASYIVGQHLLSDGEGMDAEDMIQRSETLSQVALSMKGVVSQQAVEEAMQALRSNMEEALVSQAVVEQLTENRYMALQRMMAFMTMFHAMARSVANLWPLTFDISRSQSGLRIATTAAPATASDLERTMVEIYGGELLEQEKLRRLHRHNKK